MRRGSGGASPAPRACRRDPPDPRRRARPHPPFRGVPGLHGDPRLRDQLRRRRGLRCLHGPVRRGDGPGATGCRIGKGLTGAGRRPAPPPAARPAPPGVSDGVFTAAPRRSSTSAAASAGPRGTGGRRRSARPRPGAELRPDHVVGDAPAPGRGVEAAIGAGQHPARVAHGARRPARCARRSPPGARRNWSGYR